MLAQTIHPIARDHRDSDQDVNRLPCFDMPGGLRLVMATDDTTLVPMQDGKRLPPPMIKVALPLASGGIRQMIIFRPGEAVTQPLDLHSTAGDLIARADADLPLPLDRQALTQGLDETGRLRLVRQLLDVCRDLFRLKNDAAYGRLCRSILTDLAPDSASVTAEALISQHLALVSLAVPHAIGEVSDVILVGDRGIAGGVHKPLKVAKGKSLILLDRAALKSGSLLVIIGARGFTTARVAALPLTPFLAWLQANKPLAANTRAFVMRCVADAAEQDNSTASLLRELELFQPATRRNLTDKNMPIGAAVELLVMDGKGGVFIKGWVRDPNQLTATVQLTATGIKPQRLDICWLRFPRPDIDKHYDGRPGTLGFVAYLPDAGAIRGQAKLELQLGSGATLEILARPAQGTAVQLRDAVLGGIPPEQLTTEAIAKVIAPAAVQLHAQHLATRRAPDVVQLGTPPKKPRYSIIIPLYRNLDYLRFQLGSFATDPEMAEAELIFVLDSPEQRADLVHFLSGLHQLYALPMTIVIMSANFGYAAANNAGAALARGTFLVLLNSDVVPEAAGWLSKLSAPLARDRNVVVSGARLLFDDHSLQHAGMRFARDAGGHWLNLHYYKGAPRDFAPALKSRAVPAVTGAALLVRRLTFLAVEGFTEDYIIGDYEDSDLCLKLRETGGDIHYCPDAILFHFERKSINRHAGYQCSIAGLYNRWLAGQRWDETMTVLMQRFDGATS